MWDKLKKLISLVLVAVMFLSMMPMDALAESYQTDYQLKTSVYAHKPATNPESAQVYYLKTPESIAESNNPDQWGEQFGTVTINTKDIKWESDKRNSYDNVADRVISWASGSYTLKKSGDDYKHWKAIYDAFKSSVKGIKSEDDVEAIILHPYKISQNNSTDPDKHVDCTVEIKAKTVYTAKYWLWDAGGTGYKVIAAKSLHEGDRTSPKHFNATKDLPEYKTDSESGITYVFDGWYTNKDRTGAPVVFDYKIGTDNVNFYAKYVRLYNITYQYENAPDNVTPPAAEKNVKSGSSKDVPAEPAAVNGYRFLGWASENVSNDKIKDRKYVMPENDVVWVGTWTRKTSDSLVLSGTKSYNGPTAKAFTIELYKADENWNQGDQVESKTVTVSAAAEGENKYTARTSDYQFTGITYNQIGTYRYIVKEQIPTEKNGVTYDATEYRITVTVSDNSTDTLATDVQVSKKDSSEDLSSSTQGLNFTNTYSAAGDWKPVDLEKVYHLPSGATKPAFTFNIKEGDKTVSTGSVNDDGFIAFEDIPYDQKNDLGEHTYTISEDSQDGYMVTGNDKSYKVEVSDAGNGRLSITPKETPSVKQYHNYALMNVTIKKEVDWGTITQKHDDTFIINYVVKKNTGDSEAHASGSITVGYNATTDRYTYNGTASDGVTIQVPYGYYLTVTEASDTAWVAFGEKTNEQITANQTVIIKNMLRTANLTIVKDWAHTPDDKKVPVTIKVYKGTDNKGDLVETINLPIENQVEDSESENGQNTVKKVWEKTVESLPIYQEGGTEKQKYYIEEVSLTGYNTTDNEQVVTLAADKLTTVTITNDYLYTVTYIAGKNGGFVGDADGQIEHTSLPYGTLRPAEPTPSPNDGYYFKTWSPTLDSTVTSDKTYTAEFEKKGNVTVNVPIEKSYSGPTDQTFYFQVYEEVTASSDPNAEEMPTPTPRPVGTPIQVDVAGSSRLTDDGKYSTMFPETTPSISLTFGADDLGTHTYVVKEVDDSGNDLSGTTVNGIKYDDAQTFTVTVSDPKNTENKLSAEANLEKVSFANTYSATGSWTLPTLTKRLIGGNLTDDQFTFKVYEVKSSDDKEELVDTNIIGKSKADGSIQFAQDKKTYTLRDVGEHVYEIQEESATGYWNNGQALRYTVDVSDNEDGTLNVVHSAPEGQTTQFDNYTTHTLTLSKEIKNNTLLDLGKYVDETFTLYYYYTLPNGSTVGTSEYPKTVSATLIKDANETLTWSYTGDGASADHTSVSISIPHGTTVTYGETLVGDQKDAWKAVNKATVTVVADNSVTVTNTSMLPSGAITIEKEVTNSVDNLTDEDVFTIRLYLPSDVEKTSIAYSVDGMNKTAIVQSEPDSTTQKYIAIELKEGQRAIINEVLPDDIGYRVWEAETTTGTVSGLEYTKYSITPVTNEPLHFVVKNTAKDIGGSLVISKEVKTDQQAIKAESFEIKVSATKTAQKKALEAIKLNAEPDKVINPDATNPYTYADGTLSFVIKDGESKTLTNLPNGTYTIQEDLDGRSFDVKYRDGDTEVMPDKNGITVAVNGDAKMVTVTNTPNDTIDISVEKEWVVPDYLVASEYGANVTMTLFRKTTNTTYTEVGNALEGKIAVDTDTKGWKTEWSVGNKWTDLDKYDADGNLYTYKVKETCDNLNYEGIIDSAEPEKVYSEQVVGSTNSVKFKNEYKLAEAGKLTVTKTVTDSDYDVDPNREFTVELFRTNSKTPLAGIKYKIDGSDEEQMTSDEGTVTLKAVDTLIVTEKLAIGSYTAEEVFADGVKAVWSGTDFEHSVSGELAAGTTAVPVSLELKNVRQLTTVSGSKTWNAPFATTPKVTLNLYGTVSESTSDGGTTLKYVTFVKDEDSSTEYRIVLEEEKTPTGISDTIDEGDSAEHKYSFNGGYPAYTDDGKQITYYVEESFDRNEELYMSAHPEDNSHSLINTRLTTDKKLSIEKVITAADGSELNNDPIKANANDDEFDFVIGLPSDIVADELYFTLAGEAGTALRTDDKFTITGVKNGEEIALTGIGVVVEKDGEKKKTVYALPTGDYTIMEIQDSGNTYTYEAVLTSDQGSDSDVAVAANADANEVVPSGEINVSLADKDVKVTATNKMLTESVTFVKKWQQPNGANDEYTDKPYGGTATATFELKKDGSEKAVDRVTVTWKEGKPDKTLSLNVPKDGNKYTITESRVTSDNYDISSDVLKVKWDANEMTFVFEGGNTIQNQLKRTTTGESGENAELKIEKTVEWNGTEPEETSFTIQYTYTSPDGKPVDGHVIATYKPATAGSEATVEYDKTAIAGIPYGTTVTITEDPNVAWKASYAVTTAGQDAIQATNEVTVGSAKQTVTVTNTRKLVGPDPEEKPDQENYGKIVVTKSWIPANFVAIPESIVVELYRDGGKVSEKTLTSVSGWTDTFENLPYASVDGSIYSYDVREAGEKVDGQDNRSVTYNGFTYSVTAENQIQINNRFNLTNTLMADAILPVQKKANEDSVEIGDTVDYTITFFNNEAQSVKVTIKDELPQGLEYVRTNSTTVTDAAGQTTAANAVFDAQEQKLSWVFADVPPKATVTVVFTAELTAEAVKKDEITNTASADVNDNPVSKSEGANVEVKAPKLSMTKTANRADVLPGDSIGYTLTVSNTGDGRATDVEVTDILPKQLRMTEEDIAALADDLSYDDQEHKIVWNVGTVEANSAKSLSFTATVLTESELDEQGLDMTIRNGATITKRPDSENTDPDPDDPDKDPDTATEETAIARVDVQKSAQILNPDYTEKDGEQASLGDIIRFNVVVTNKGACELNNVVVSDVMIGKAIAESIKVEPAEAAVFATERSAANGSEVMILDTLPVGEKATFTYDYLVTEEDLLAGAVSNTATAMAESEYGTDVSGGDETHTSTDKSAPTLTVEKALVEKAPVYRWGAERTTYMIGETIQYLLTVTNTGNVSVENIVLTDILTSAANAAGKVETIELEQSLAPGESVTVEYAYTVQEADLLPAYEQDGVTALRHYVQNTATVTGTDALGTACEATSNMVTAEAEHLVLVRFIDSQTGTVLKGDYIPFGGSTPPPVEREVPDYPGYTFNGWWGGIWETVYTDQNVFTNYVRREGWYPPREDNGTAIIDAEIPLAGGYISNVGDCFD